MKSRNLAIKQNPIVTKSGNRVRRDSGAARKGVQNGRGESGAAWVISILLFMPMLILPAMALVKVFRAQDARYVVIYLLMISLITAFAYWSDKKRAQRALWRIAESRLHLFELAGGWMIAFWAQRVLRHKIRKASYQVTFWSIGLFHQYLAYDFMQNWYFSHRVFEYLNQFFA